MIDDDHQKMVRDFHNGIGGQKADAELRISLIQEEAEELVEAINEQDVYGAIDAICDLLYVTYGTAEVYDVALNTEEASKITPGTEVRWAKLRSECPDFVSAVGLVVETIRSANEFNRNKLQAVLEDLAVGLWKCAALGIGIDLRPFYREVHRTNMHKLHGPKRSDGKQLKPPDWKPPRIKAMYERLQAGLAPHCRFDCIGTSGENFDIAMTSQHPDGGRVCDRCGGFIVEVDL